VLVGLSGGCGTTVEQHGHIDVLINNAGTSLPQVRIDQIEEDQWRQVAGPTLDGPLFMSRAVLPSMRRNVTA